MFLCGFLFFFLYFVPLVTEKVVLVSKKLISTNKRHAEHPFAGRNTQQWSHCSMIMIALFLLCCFNSFYPKANGPKIVKAACYQILSRSQILQFIIENFYMGIGENWKLLKKEKPGPLS